MYGDTGFVNIIRTSVLENTTAERDITFVEAEFQPRGSEYINHKIIVSAWYYFRSLGTEAGPHTFSISQVAVLKANMSV